MSCKPALRRLSIYSATLHERAALLLQRANCKMSGPPLDPNAIAPLDREILKEIMKHRLCGPDVVDGMTLTDGNPVAQSVYIKLL